jgi:hypothetical protein
VEFSTYRPLVTYAPVSCAKERAAKSNLDANTCHSLPGELTEMALLWQTKSSAMSSAPGIQLRTRRPLWRTLFLVILIAISGFLILHSLSQLHTGFCQSPTALASSGLCSSILRAGWSLFYHLGGNGPWIRRIDGRYYYDAPLPKKCSIDQVHMVSIAADR